jgi:excisionase family DNA binding protein
LGYAQMASKQVSRNLASYRKSSAFLVSPRRHQGRAMEMPISLSGLDPIVAEIEAHAGTMVDNDNNKRRRLVEFKDGCRYGKFGKTKAYELIAHERIRAYKMGGKTMIDLDSVDEYHASLPRVETRAS